MPRIQRDARTRRENLRSLKQKGLLQEYWEEQLRRRGFSMDAGRAGRVSYVGSLDNLESVMEENLRYKLGAVETTGTSGDTD